MVWHVSSMSELGAHGLLSWQWGRMARRILSRLATTSKNGTENHSRGGNIFVCVSHRDACVRLRTGAKMRATGGEFDNQRRRRAEETMPHRYTPQKPGVVGAMRRPALCSWRQTPTLRERRHGEMLNA